MVCSKCHSEAIIKEKVYYEGRSASEFRCLICGNREWPEEIKEIRSLNRAVYMAKEKTRHRMRPMSKGYYGPEDKFLSSRAWKKWAKGDQE